ncbi:MAG: neutral zinc metallopeptidase, partial [Rhizobiales bacterium]|nr:neutral zinc metallopeptidase [Hyphomicrobiales bacterium]
MRLDDLKQSDNVEDRRGQGGMGGGFGFPRGGGGGGLNIPVGGRGGGFSIRTIIVLIIVYFVVKFVFGVDLIQAINNGGVPVPGGGDSQIVVPGGSTGAGNAGG